VTVSRSVPSSAAAADSGPADVDARRPASGRAASTAVRWTVLAVAAALLALQTFWRGHLSGVVEYDDGVYYAASDALLHGVVPYRDYAFIQPPFVTVLLAPFALAARAVGSAHAFEAARVGVALVGLGNVALVGRLLRGRPTGQQVAGMVVMALYPGALSSAQTVLIEPLLVGLALLAALALFSDGEVSAASGRQWLAGALFGIAVATKIWALVPLAVAVVLLWWLARRDRAPMRSAARAAVGAMAGAMLCCLPFALANPSAFVRQVFVVQSIRPAGGYARPERLADLSGTAGLVHVVGGGAIGQALTEGVIAIAACLLAVQFGLRWRGCRAASPVELFGAASAVAVAIALLWAPTYYYHYSGFVAPFLALAAPRLVACWTQAWPSRRAVVVPVVAAALVAGVAVADVLTTVQSPRPRQVSDAFRTALGPARCVLSLQPSLTVLAGRDTTRLSGCAPVIDYQGAERVYADGLSQDPADERNPVLQREFQRWLNGADAIVVATASPSWGPDATRYVMTHFTRIALPAQGVTVYRRHG
jgi:uncharacterized membrane protein